ncbi:hypothetical protein Rhopal_004468-T1 [Rhodotorula paludigena]|uniref:MAGE domain-containing protein n=1 Tax=Rhodotorula paludigena TaxID=86838 RepID=A0AAV5GFX6_9BASI|nr:hypothetical protein Rhopal_004468-T1 [Rhodotorula paludigena]
MARTQASQTAHSGEHTDYDDQRASKQRRKSTQTEGKGKAKGKGKRARRGDDDEDDEDDDDAGDASDSSSDDGVRKKGDLSDEEKKHYIQGIVRYVLFNESHRRILKREDIVKNVLTDGRGKHFNALLPKVQKVLKDVLGMELVALRARETSKSQGKAWIVRSTIPQPLLRHAATHRYPSLSTVVDHPGSQKGLRAELAAWEADEATTLPGDGEDEGVEAAVMRDVKREEGAVYGVLGVVLALILVNGKVLGDDQLISYLRRLSLTPSTPLPLSLSSPHPQSLDLSAFLNLLTRQQYLERSKTGQAPGGATQGGTTQGGGASGRGRTQGPSRTQRTNAAGEKAEAGDPSVEWRWGPRADAEVGELGVGKFVQRIFLSQSEKEGEVGGGRKRGKTGERFLKEVARAAGTKDLADVDGEKGSGAAADKGKQRE